MSSVFGSPSGSSRPTYSCVRCSDRKVRCDRQYPCGACLKHNVQCLFRMPPSPRRKKKRVKEGTLRDKLVRYEVLLQKLGVDPNELPNTSEAEDRTIGGSETTTVDTLQLLTLASTTAETEQSITKSQLLQGQGGSNLVDK